MFAIQSHVMIFGIALLWCVAFQPAIIVRLFYILKKNLRLSLFNGDFRFVKYSFLNQALAITLIFLAVLRFGNDFLIAIPLCLILIQLTLFDIRYFWLPDRLTLPLILSGLCLSLQSYDHFLSSMLGAFAGFLMFQLPRMLFNRALSRETLGTGDIKLAVAMGVWLGIEQLPLTISLACLLAAMYYFLFLKRSASADRKIALGVFLSMAFWPVWILV